MKFITISDTHGEHRELKLPTGDAIIHAGDFCQHGRVADALDFLEWYDALDFATKILIGGNHDFFAADESKRFNALLPSGITYLNDSGTVVNGIQIWGSPVQPDLTGWAFGKPRGKAMRKHWNLIPATTDLLVTHTPPYGILDKSRSKRSLGCEELSKRLDELDVAVHVFGHIHASYGQVTIGSTHYINASNYNSRRGLVNKPVVFEL